MTDIHLTATQATPAVIATTSSSTSDGGLLEMSGDSYPENSFEFFTPIFKWVEAFFENSEDPLRVELHLLYLNTSSVKAMMDIFDLIEEAFNAGKKASVKWYYDSDNERIAELAEEFKEDCSFPFEINQLT
jgi:hypothetical protein